MGCLGQFLIAIDLIIMSSIQHFAFPLPPLLDFVAQMDCVNNQEWSVILVDESVVLATYSKSILVCSVVMEQQQLSQSIGAALYFPPRTHSDQLKLVLVCLDHQLQMDF